MKTLSQKVIQTNTGKMRALAIAKATGGCAAKNYADQTFYVKDYVFAEGTLDQFDDESGELLKSESLNTLTMVTTEGDIVGTSSTFVQHAFNEILDVVADDELDLETIPLIIKKGESENGKGIYCTIEIDFNSLDDNE